ncbi:hypothetical protein NGB25_12935 [Staphylococcus saprophyticus]|uniref:hypothetical protein n=1 Tax=Staphylococcus saprophyticus TaxID=29385 RepID=UPI002DBB416B|nr:hypothetical protein [Staphylococcus saprophyticus]MEB7678006.1 hypothetical protein [Staphylococcus saprophyticus]
MFEYRKALKRVEYIESLINSIKNNEENSGYRVEINFANGKLYEDKDDTFDVDVYVTKNYRNYNSKGMTMRIKGNTPAEDDYRLPCRIKGDPIKSKGIIKDIAFDKANILKELKDNKKYITNERLGTIEVPCDNDNRAGEDNVKSFTINQIYPQNITVYFEE